MKCTSFPLETEMAWFVLLPFLNPLDCSKKCGDNVFPLNTNQRLEQLFNGNPQEPSVIRRPYYFSKLRLQAHLANVETYYYRSRWNAVARTGFGSSDKAARQLAFADRFCIDGKCTRFPKVGIMLLGIDIDCHNGEKDVERVRDLLLSDFPGSYWERSTNGKGIHLYLKLAFPTDLKPKAFQTNAHVRDILKLFEAHLEQQRVAAGLDAPIDHIRGLPSAVEWNAKEKRVVISRSLCIKLPRFANGESDIMSFVNAPYVTWDYLHSQVDNTTVDSSPHDGDDDLEVGAEAVSSVLDSDVDQNKPEREEEEALLYCNSAYPDAYETLIQTLRNEPDAFERTCQMALAYARHLKRVPSALELMDEYEAQKLNTGSDDDGNRSRRMEMMQGYLTRTFEPGRLQFTYEGFDETKWVAALTPFIDEKTDCRYRKGKDRPVTMRELAILYFALAKSQGSRPKTVFSISQVQDAFRKVTGNGISRNKASGLLRILTDKQIIARVGGYVPGMRGSTWKVRQPE